MRDFALESSGERHCYRTVVMQLVKPNGYGDVLIGEQDRSDGRLYAFAIDFWLQVY